MKQSPMRRHQWRSFLEAFAESLEHTAIVVPRKPIVAWRDHVALNSLALRSWASPDPHRLVTPPAIVRVCTNYLAFDASKALLQRLGFAPRARPSSAEDLRLEWTMMDDQLAGFAAWLPIWLRSRRDPSTVVPPPPHPSVIWGSLETTNYAWTEVARDEYDAWTKPFAMRREAMALRARQAAQASTASEPRHADIVPQPVESAVVDTP